MTALENQKAALLFQEIAEFLELKGENPFKIRAYQKAARAVQGVEKPLRDLRAEGELRKIPGIGKAIADKIEQLLDEGVIRLHQELRGEFPDDILTLTSIPGLGAKKTAVLYRELGVGCIEDLKKVLQEGKIAELKGFGKKTEERLLDGLKRLESADRRLPLGQAQRLADHFTGLLSEIEGVERVQVAGSFRRGRDTVGDLDLLVVAADSAPVMQKFCGDQAVESVILRGETKSSVRLHDGFQVDLRVVPAESFGAALQYFTGSQDHNIRLRALAEKRGWKLNEYGLFDGDNSSVAGVEEKDIYAALELQFIPPELRQNGSEIELAARRELPALLELDHICGNLHTHSEWSDGDTPVSGLADKADSLGYQYLAVTDHSRALVIANGLTPERLLRQKEEIKAANSDHKVQLLWATECDILPDGKMDFDDELLSQLDLVVGAVHSSFHLSQEAMTERILAAIYNPHVDIIAHPTGRKLGGRPGYAADWEVIFKAAAETGTALEINASPKRLDLSDQMVRRAAALGVLVSIGTDAHSLREFEYMSYGVRVARRGWLTGEQVINSWPKDKLLAWLAKEKGR